MDFLKLGFIVLRNFPSVPSLWCFYHESVLNFFQMIFGTIEFIMCLVLLTSFY